jgi:teichuronic acid biosynthesis glycosyltransferase TuaC
VAALSNAPRFLPAASGEADALPGRGLRVLTITNMYPTPERPAYGSFVEAQVSSLRRAGVGMDVHFIDGRRSKWEYVSAFATLRRRLARGGYDLVHAHYGFSGFYPIALASPLPLVTTFHGDDVMLGENLPRLKTFVRELVSRRADAVIVQSAEMKEILGLESARVIPMGVDLERFRPMDRSACRLAAGYAPDLRYALFPYDRSRRVKGFDLAAAAVALVTRINPAVRLRTVAGEPPERMPLHFNAADLLLFTSLREGSPTAVKEALACDLPIVATAAGDVAERIAGVAGCWLVERSADRVASAVLRVLEDHDPRSAGRAAVGPLDIGAVALRLIEVYRTLVPRHA